MDIGELTVVQLKKEVHWNDFNGVEQTDTVIKNENNIDIFYEDIKREIGEDNFSSETKFIDQKQNDLINLQDFELQPLLNNDKSPNNLPGDLILPKRSVSPQNNVFVTKSSGLKTHELINIHAGEKPSQCKTFNTLRYLKAHKSSHTDEKQFHCKVCSKTFVLNSSNLKMHNRMHRREKQFHCKICSKYVSSLKVLKDHERIHAEEKPFYCKICLKIFTMNLSNFMIHERIHTGAKPFCCKICSKYFTSLQYMKVHQRVHTDEKQFRYQLNFESS